MRRRRRSLSREWYDAPAKQPVPAHGIAAGRFGDTWWGREWIASLERLGRTWSNRLPRGRSYARQGRVVDLEVGAGVVSAGAVGTRSRPYRVEILLPALDAEGWRRGIDRLADDTLLVLRLLNRELPDEVGEMLRKAGVELFPNRRELRTRCSCPDVANPCKHVAAVHYVFAAALDNDPFLLFRLRGLGRDDLLAALADGDAEVGKPPVDGDEDAGYQLERVDQMDVATFTGADLTPPVLDVDPRSPRVELVGLRRLGPPPRGLEHLSDEVAPAVRAAGRLAAELAWREQAPHALSEGAGRAVREVERTRSAAPRRRQDAATAVVSSEVAERLVRRVESELSEAERPLSKRELVEVTGAGGAQVTRALRSLRDARLVAARGRGPATRYALVEQSPPAPRRRPEGTADDLSSHVIEVLAGSGESLSMRVLAGRVGITPKQLRPVVVALRQNGVVEMVGRRRSARYRLAR